MNATARIIKNGEIIGEKEITLTIYESALLLLQKRADADPNLEIDHDELGDLINEIELKRANELFPEHDDFNYLEIETP